MQKKGEGVKKGNRNDIWRKQKEESCRREYLVMKGMEQYKEIDQGKEKREKGE